MGVSQPNHNHTKVVEKQNPWPSWRKSTPTHPCCITCECLLSEESRKTFFFLRPSTLSFPQPLCFQTSHILDILLKIMRGELRGHCPGEGRDKEAGAGVNWLTKLAVILVMTWEGLMFTCINIWQGILSAWNEIFKRTSCTVGSHAPSSWRRKLTLNSPGNRMSSINPNSYSLRWQFPTAGDPEKSILQQLPLQHESPGQQKCLWDPISCYRPAAPFLNGQDISAFTAEISKTLVSFQKSLWGPLGYPARCLLNSLPWEGLAIQSELLVDQEARLEFAEAIKAEPKMLPNLLNHPS